MIQRSNEAIKSAAADVTAARQILPAMPFTKEAALQAAQMGVFLSMMGGMGADMMQAMMIRKSMDNVREMEGQVKECATWVQRNLDAFTMEATRMRAEAGAKATEAAALQVARLEAAAAV